jgi:hypothetical protein
MPRDLTKPITISCYKNEDRPEPDYHLQYLVITSNELLKKWRFSDAGNVQEHLINACIISKIEEEIRDVVLTIIQPPSQNSRSALSMPVL